MIKKIAANEGLHPKPLLLKDKILPTIIVFFLPVMLYLQTLNYSFTCFDDDLIITKNMTFLSHFRNAPQAFLKDAFLEKGTPLYRPLQTISYMADIQVSGGNNPWMYHLTNILLLGLISCLLFIFFRKLIIPLRLALLSTLVYCVHPLFISSIAWIPARGDLLLLVFSLSSFLFFIKHLENGKVIYLILNWLTFTVALFCKETAVILPFLFILYYFTFLSDGFRNKKKYLFSIVLYAISGISWFWLRSVSIGDFSNQNEVGLMPFLANLRTIPESLAMFFLPVDIAPIPGFSLLRTLTGVGIIIIIIVIFFITEGRTKKEKVFCLTWFLFLLLPTLFYKMEYIDYLNHRFFLPLIGIKLFVLFIIPKKWFDIKGIKSTWFMVAILVVLSSVTFVKTQSYSDPLTFYNTSISRNPDNALLYNNRGNVKVQMGDLQGAINDYTKAIKLNPNFALAYYNRVNAIKTGDDHTGTMKEYNKAIELNPKNADAYINRGNAYNEMGNYEMAIKDYDSAIQLNPDDAGAYNNRGIAYNEKGDLEMAIKDYNKSIALNPHFTNVYNNRGIAYAQKGDLEMAIKDYDKAIELDPNYVNAYYNRGIAYKDRGMLKEAEKDLKKYEALMNN